MITSTVVLPTVPAVLVTELDTLVGQIRAEHQAVLDGITSTIKAAIRAGMHLHQAKTLVARGEWCSWLKANFEKTSGLSSRSANVYMRAFEFRDEILALLAKGKISSLREAIESVSTPRRATLEIVAPQTATTAISAPTVSTPAEVLPIAPEAALVAPEAEQVSTAPSFKDQEAFEGNVIDSVIQNLRHPLRLTSRGRRMILASAALILENSDLEDYQEIVLRIRAKINS